MLRVTETLATIAAMAAFSAVTFLWRVRTNTAATVLAPDLGKICLTQRSVMKTEAQPVTRRQRLVHGLKEYAAISIYLYVVFGALLLYKTSTLQAYGDDYTPYGLAAVKALILAKFMLVAHEMHLGERHRNKSLVYKILYRSIIFPCHAGRTHIRGGGGLRCYSWPHGGSVHLRSCGRNMAPTRRDMLTPVAHLAAVFRISRD
jgi:hypothetical protein